MLKVAILDDYQNVSQEFVDLKKLSGKYEFKIFSEPFLDEADAIEQLSDFEALLIMRERTPITKNLIDNLNDLKYIITSGSRNKAIDLEAAKKRRIIVCGTEINFNPTCELTWALILGLSKNLKTEIDNMYQGYWQTTVGFELRGKIIGLIGLGRVGSQVAKIANAFGMQVIAWSENLDLDKCKELNVLPCSKEDLIKTSDYISIHVPLVDETKDLISKKSLKHFKKGAKLINLSRGGIVNNEDIIEALDAKIIDKFVTDFPTPELVTRSNDFHDVILLPHLGASTKEAEINCAVMAAEQISNFLKDGVIVNSVNFPSIKLGRKTEYRMVIINKNEPGMIGKITDEIGYKHITIADMTHKSRDSIGINLIDLEDKPSQELIENIKNIDHVISVRLCSNL